MHLAVLHALDSDFRLRHVVHEDSARGQGLEIVARHALHPLLGGVVEDGLGLRFRRAQPGVDRPLPLPCGLHRGHRHDGGRDKLPRGPGARRGARPVAKQRHRRGARGSGWGRRAARVAELLWRRGPHLDIVVSRDHRGRLGALRRADGRHALALGRRLDGVPLLHTLWVFKHRDRHRGRHRSPAVAVEQRGVDRYPGRRAEGHRGDLRRAADETRQARGHDDVGGSGRAYRPPAGGGEAACQLRHQPQPRRRDLRGVRPRPRHDTEGGVANPHIVPWRSQGRGPGPFKVGGAKNVAGPGSADGYRAEHVRICARGDAQPDIVFSEVVAF
mmetsp:Transcript_47619/g.137002  ORF Transcript_47619/g.137002 Transcript_47619/m.137002 type:complete len:330 (+) Transcript_47619:1252-2241(+)